MNIYNYSNCYEKCPYYYYIDNNNNSICINDTICPEAYPKLIVNKSECIKDDKYKYESTFIDQEYQYKTSEIILGTLEEIDYNISINKNIKYTSITEMIKNISMNITDNKVSHYDKLLKLIEKYFQSEEFDTSNLDKGNDEFIPFEDMLVILTTTLNQKNNINNNMTLINLEECEYLLRKFYNISDNETLYIKK